jgi:hypothetical protein
VALYTVSRADAPGDATRPSNAQVIDELRQLGYVVSDVYQDEANIYVEATTDPTTDVNAITVATYVDSEWEDEFWDHRAWGEAGSGSVTQAAPFDFDTPGVIKIATSAVSGEVTRIFKGTGGSDGLLLPDSGFDVTWIVYFESGASVANVTTRIGWADVWADDPPSDGIYFQFGTASANWRFITRQGGTSTDSDSGTAAALSTLYRLRVRKERKAAQTYFSVDDGAETLHTSNITTMALSPGLQIRSHAAASKSVNADYFKIKVPGIKR